MLVQIQPRQPVMAVRKPLGGEIESRLVYTQKSRGQNLPERPFASWRNQQRAGL